MATTTAVRKQEPAREDKPRKLSVWVNPDLYKLIVQIQAKLSAPGDQMKISAAARRALAEGAANILEGGAKAES